MAEHNDIGRWGEDIAIEYMISKGWYLRHRNWHYNSAEIDMIFIDEDDTMLLFVEVKTRTSDEYGLPEESVDAQKRARIVNAASYYMNSYMKENREVRYDIISIIGTPDSQYTIKHIEDAFTMIDVYEDFVSSRRWRR